MSSREILAIVALAALLALAGCKQPAGTGPHQGYGFIEPQISSIAGASGIYYVTAPSSNVNLTIELTNEMAANATDVRLGVSNVNPQVLDFSELTSHAPFRLAPYQDPHGGLWFTSISAKLPLTEPKRTYTTQIQYHVCATATTEYSGTVCLAPKAEPGSYTATCTPGSVSVTGGQAAPVAVTAVREDDTATTDTISIDVVNLGGGLVFNASKTSECSFIDQQDSGVITLTKLELGGVGLSNCVPQTERMGYTQKYQQYTGATFTCTIQKKDYEGKGGPFNITSTASTSLYAEFEYGYHADAGTESIIIEKPPK